MNDLFALALAVVLLALSECVWWVPHGALLVRSGTFFGAPRLRSLARAFGTAHGAFVVLNPIPPFGRAYVVAPWPFCFDEGGVVAARTFAVDAEPLPPSTGDVRAWEAIRRIQAIVDEVFVDGDRFVRCASTAEARHAADVLEAVRAAPAASRGAVIDAHIGAHLDPKPVAEVARRHVRLGVPLLAACVALFGTLFIGVPVAVHADGLARWPLLLGAVYAGVALVGVAFTVAHRALRPGALGERVGALLLFLPAPTMALRAQDRLARHLLAGRHPFAAAVALLRGPHREDVVGRMLRDLEQPRATAIDGLGDEARRIERAFRLRVLARAQRVATEAGLDMAALTAPPRLPAGCTAYCPRCHGTYRTAASCTDCALPLVRPNRTV